MKQGSRIAAFCLLLCYSMTLGGHLALAEELSVHLSMSPHQNTHITGWPVTLEAVSKASNLEYIWRVVGPGSIQGSGAKVTYQSPLTIEQDPSLIEITVIVRDTIGREAYDTITFNLKYGPPPPSGMSTGTKIAIGAGSAALLGGGIWLATRDDDDDDTELLDMNGEWVFSGDISADTCWFVDMGYPTSTSERILVHQNGTAITAEHRLGDVLRGNWTFAGSAGSDTFTLAATNPLTETYDGCTVSLGAGMDAHSVQDRTGNGTMNITANAIEGCSGSCQIVWSGTWERL